MVRGSDIIIAKGKTSESCLKRGVFIGHGFIYIDMKGKGLRKIGLRRGLWSFIRDSTVLSNIHPCNPTKARTR